MDSEHHNYLKRLPAHYYQGTAWVHWVMTIEKRATGWLDGLMHSRVREALLHTCDRYKLVCPAYVLMPDHAHFVWCGRARSSDQLRAVSFFRRQWNDLLRESGFVLQKQPYDHVLREQERDPEAFQNTCVYVMKNPERAGLVKGWREWDACGSVIGGYPWVDLREDRFWEKFWTAYNTIRKAESS